MCVCVYIYIYIYIYKNTIAFYLISVLPFIMSPLILYDFGLEFYFSDIKRVSSGYLF